MQQIDITDDNLWMIQLVLNWILTVSVQRNWADLDPDRYGHAQFFKRSTKCRTCSRWPRWHGGTAIIMSIIKCRAPLTSILISKHYRQSVLLGLSETKYRPEVTGSLEGDSAPLKWKKKTWFMTCGWIINLLISAGAADRRLHFWPLENYSSYSCLVIQADRERKWKWQRISCNSWAF